MGMMAGQHACHFGGNARLGRVVCASCCVGVMTRQQVVDLGSDSLMGTRHSAMLISSRHSLLLKLPLSCHCLLQLRLQALEKGFELKSSRCVVGKHAQGDEFLVVKGCFKGRQNPAIARNAAERTQPEQLQFRIGPVPLPRKQPLQKEIHRRSLSFYPL
jgi:hypothetical protein